MSVAVPATSEITHESGYAKGVAVAIVTQNQDEDGLCRVKVRYPWHDKPRESYWARLAVQMAGKGRGTVSDVIRAIDFASSSERDLSSRARV